MKKQTETITEESLDEEIASLRALIKQAADQQTSGMALEDLVRLVNAVGKNLLNLAQTLKIKAKLVSLQNDPGAVLHQSLLELEEEWPELKKFLDKFPSSETPPSPGNSKMIGKEEL